MNFGADYYPEHWPRDRWPEDARLMREAGFNTVRLAEFAWALMEPEEGRFEFDWLDEALDVLGREGIRAVIGTPTAAAPAWLGEKYPDTRRMDEWRRVVTFGNRQHSCINSPNYRRASAGIVQAMAERFGRSEHVIAWQIDNEFGPYCYCDICRGKFQGWLRERYGSLDSLNSAWGTVFWSQIYTDWSQIPLPWATGGSPNPGLALDYRRFMSESYESFETEQIEIIRELSPGRKITHNFMGFYPEQLDYRALASHLDFASWDNYPMLQANTPAAVALSHDLTRGLKHRNFWVMEEQSGPTGWAVMGPAPRPGQIRLWTYQAIAHGADGILFFRWRPARFGTEQYWHGILDHDGSTNRRYEEVKQVGAELAKLSELLQNTEVRAETAIVNDYDSRFAFQVQQGGVDFSYPNAVLPYYTALFRHNVACDVIQTGDDFSGYKLIILPAMLIIRPALADRLREFVRGGGLLLATYRTAVKDEFGRILDEPLPGMLRDVFGMRVMEYHSPARGEKNSIRGRMGVMSAELSKASVWMDVLKPQGAEVLAEYVDGFGSGRPGATISTFGRGAAVYVGTQVEQHFADRLIELLMDRAGLAPGPAAPEGVESAVQCAADRRIVFFLNHTGAPTVIQAPADAHALLGTEETIEPYGVRVFMIEGP